MNLQSFAKDQFVFAVESLIGDLRIASELTQENISEGLAINKLIIKQYQIHNQNAWFFFRRDSTLRLIVACFWGYFSPDYDHLYVSSSRVLFVLHLWEVFCGDFAIAFFLLILIFLIFFVLVFSWVLKGNKKVFFDLILLENCSFLFASFSIKLCVCKLLVSPPKLKKNDFSLFIFSFLMHRVQVQIPSQNGQIPLLVFIQSLL